MTSNIKFLERPVYYKVFNEFTCPICQGKNFTGKELLKSRSIIEIFRDKKGFKHYHDDRNFKNYIICNDCNISFYAITLTKCFCGWTNANPEQAFTIKKPPNNICCCGWLC